MERQGRGEVRKVQYSGMISDRGSGTEIRDDPNPDPDLGKTASRQFLNPPRYCKTVGSVEV